MYNGHIFWELENHQMVTLVLVKKNLGRLERIGDNEARTWKLRKTLIIQHTSRNVCPINPSSFPFPPHLDTKIPLGDPVVRIMMSTYPLAGLVTPHTCHTVMQYKALDILYWKESHLAVNAIFLRHLPKYIILNSLLLLVNAEYLPLCTSFDQRGGDGENNVKWSSHRPATYSGNTKEPTTWTQTRKAGQTNETHQDQFGFVNGAYGQVSLGLL